MNINDIGDLGWLRSEDRPLIIREFKRMCISFNFNRGQVENYFKSNGRFLNYSKVWHIEDCKATKLEDMDTFDFKLSLAFPSNFKNNIKKFLSEASK